MLSNAKERVEDWQQLPVLDRNQLDESAGFDFVFAFQILETFFMWLPNTLGTLAHAIQGKDWDSIRYQAHTAKGGCRAIGAIKLSAMFNALEHEKGLPEAETLLRQLCDEFYQVQALTIKLGLYLVRA